jgi:hypothetical protein
VKTGRDSSLRAPAGGNSPARAGRVAAAGVAGSHNTPPGIEDILALKGFERIERFGEWLCTAGTADLRLFAVALKSAEIRDSKISDALMLRWVELDVADALAFSKETGTFSTAVWWAWGKLDPEQALAAAVSENGPGHGAEALRGLAQSDPERAKSFMERYPQFVNRSSIEGIVSGLFDNDPLEAAEMALRVDSDEARNCVAAWARRDPDTALTWAQNIDSPGQRRQMLAAILRQWELTNPEMVEPALLSLPPSSDRNLWLAEHAGRLALTCSDADPAVAFACAQPDGVRQTAMGTIAQSLALKSPSDAMKFLRGRDWSSDPALRGATETPGFAKALSVLGQTLPQEAMAFAATMGEGGRRPVERTVFQSWMNNDLESASGWLAAQPADSRDRTCVDFLVDHLSQAGPDRDCEGAVRWALSMPDLEQNFSRLQNAFSSWMKSDPAAARQGLLLPGVPENVRNAFREGAAP